MAENHTALWGQQTEQALKHFAIGSEVMPAEFIHAYAMLKWSTAATHKKHQKLPDNIASAIMQAAREMMDSELDEQFPLSVWQSGSGTQFHMNVNEVLATRANAILNPPSAVHANDHCNLGQSTNDSFPTAMHIACVLQLESKLLPALSALIAGIEHQSNEMKAVIKTGRTHLQDAVPVTLGQTFSGYATQLSHCRDSITGSLKVLKQLTIGGTAVGTGINSYAHFATGFCAELQALTGIDFVPTDNRFSAQAAHDDIVQLSGNLNTLACALNKIASDLRLMASGPRCGLGEIVLPANEPGSSIMPGKVNPSQCEMVNMVCAQVMGNHTTISMAGAQGQLELNTFKPVIAFNILQSLQLLGDAMNSFNTYCINGLKANSSQLASTMEKSLMLVTVLTDVIGYDKAAELVRFANTHSLTLREAVLKTGVMPIEQFDQSVQAERMLRPDQDD
jgi:fumarate hydratase class II